MHEANFTGQIVAAILEEVGKYPLARPKKVKVSVGEMLHLVPESVQAHYDSMTRGTRLQEVLLELRETPVEVRCGACQGTGGVEDHHLLQCSHCGSLNVTLLNGNQILIDSIEAEE